MAILKRALADRPRLLFEELEPRILYSADAAALLGLNGGAMAEHVREFDAPSAKLADQVSQNQASHGLEIIFIDSRVPDAYKLADELMAQRGGAVGFEVVIINAEQDGVAQISRILANEQGLAAIHIISHGSEGAIEIGNGRLDGDRLAVDADAVARWGKALSADGDLLLYGCDVAQGAAGRAFVQDLARLTGADVAASTGLTGSVSVGGDWVLEFATGTVHTSLTPNTFDRLDWSGVLATYTVNSTADTNTGSGTTGTLRWVINQANASVGVDDIINFNIAGAGVQTISIGAGGLPSINDRLTIDGSTQSGYAGTPLIRIDGNGAGAGSNGITISGSGGGSVVRGLMITRFNGDGVNIASGANNVTIASNWIGTAGTGTTGVGNNDDGIEIAGSSATITGNVITNNADEGITIVGSGVTGHVIQGNIIGLDPDGATNNGIGDVGIALISGTGNTIGGTTAAARNVISRMTEGIEINTANNIVQGNYIGTDVSGTLNRGNRSGDGVQIQGSANDTVVGGTAVGAGNLIAYNSLNGVAIRAGTGHQVLSNTIYLNASLGIDLGASGVTANDAGDGDSGANDLQNFPVLTSANSNASGTTIIGSLNSNASTTFRIEFFANRPSIADATNGEGERYLGFITLTTNASGNAIINTTLANTWVNSGDRISATATVDRGAGIYGSTSEFAANVTASSTGIIVVDTTSDVVDGTTTSITNLGASRGTDGRISLREAIIAANNTANGGTPDKIVFAIPAALQGGVHTINVSAAGLPAITQALIIDATTEPDFAGSPMVELNGGNLGTLVKGLHIGAGSGGSTVKGLIINRFTGTGLEINGSNSHTVQGNWIGLDATGTSAAANAVKGIYVLNSTGNLIGGTTAAQRNVVSGNTQQGIYFDNADNSVISGNYIGTNAAGTGDITGTTAVLGQSGVVLTNGASGNVVGGTTAGARNVISGNNHYGFEVQNLTSQNNLLQGNYIGTTADGMSALGNSGGGVSFWGSGTGNMVGGSVANAGNVISGNASRGVQVGNGSTGATIAGNLIGLGADGDNIIGNGTYGISVISNSTATTIGGATSASRNVISGNASFGVYLASTASGSSVLSNYIGTNAAGTAARANLDGVWIDGSTDNIIGQAGAGNLISGNTYHGIAVDGASATGNLVRANLIGSNAGSTGALANLGHGVVIDNAAFGNSIGGSTAGAGNLIAFNSGDGVSLPSLGAGNSILGNAIHGNADLGIDYANDGVTFNGSGLQNFPVLISATPGASSTINGTLSGAASTSFRIEFFANSAADPSGYGEGQRYLGSVNVTTNAGGTASFSPTVASAVASGERISATATNLSSNSTSEFARNIVANNAPTLSNGATVVLPTTNEDTTSSATSVDTLLIGASWADADSGAFRGMAVIGKTGSAGGAWQYSTDGATWTAMGGVSAANALLLTSTSQVRYIPDAINAEIATFSFRAWDQTSGSASANGAPSYAVPGVGGGASAYSNQTASASITVSAVNDAPVVTTTGGALAYAENAAATVIDAGVTVVDVDHTQMNRATVAITGNYDKGQDVLAFVDQNGIIGNWDAGTGVLTLSNIATKATYEAALRSVTYVNTSDAPSTAARTVSFVARDTGNLNSAAATRTINITVSNDAPTFHSGSGLATTGFAAGATDMVNAVAVQTDGKIIAVGYTLNAGNRDIAVVRYNADGTLDSSFGGGTGKLTTVVGASDEIAQSVVLLADGKILVTGSTYTGVSYDIVLVQYNADGTLDNTFGGGTGIARSGLAGSDEGFAVSVQSDGKILVAGKDNANFLLARFLANGTLDTAFGSGGKVLTDFAGSNDYAYSMTLQSDGKILLGGAAFSGTSFDFGVARYNADGTLDTTFNGTGKVLIDLGVNSNDNGRSITTQADGKILVAGWSDAGGTNDFALVRLNSDGSLDTTFNGTGKVTTAIGTGSDLGLSVVVQSDAKILVAGQSNSNGGNFAATRYNSNGSLDTTFNGTGKVDTNFGASSDDRGAALLVQVDGKIVVAGTSTINGNHDFAIARYNADGSLDARFNTSNTLGGSVAYAENAAAVVLDNNVTIFDAELSALNNFSGATLTLVRNGGAKAQDLFSASGALGSLTQGGSLVYSGTTIGTVTTNGGGTLLLSFNGNATESFVNSAIRLIAYANSSEAPPASVQINWTFNDGNAGSQGSGGALMASGTTTVNITAVNDPPTNLSTGISLNRDGGTDAYLVDSSSGVPYWQGFTGITMEFRVSDMQTPVSMATLYSKRAAGSASYFAVLADGTLNWNGFQSTGKYNQLYDGGVHSIAFSWNTPTGSLRFYIDGAFVEARSTSVQAQTNGGGIFTLGQQQHTVGGGFLSDQRFTGTFQDVRVWNHVRSDADIAQNANYKLAMSAAEAASRGLVANWQMDGLVAGTVTDISNGYVLAIGHASGAGYTNSTPSDSPSVAENSANGTHVGYVVPADADSGDAHVYSLTDTAGGRFAIGPANGRITVANGSLLDFEAAASHTIIVRATDSAGLYYEEAVTIRLTDVNEAPTVSTSAGVLAYTENQPAATIDGGLTIGDVDSANLTGATVSISANYANGQDVLAFGNQLGIAGSWSAATGVLTLSGTSSVANYETALRSVTYFNSSDDPGTLTRTISFVVNDGALNSGVATKSVTVIAQNDAPLLAGANNLASINRNPVSNPGTLVADLIAGHVSDADAGPAYGIAVTAVDNTNGTWQYSTNGGGAWIAFGAPVPGVARLLAADANSYVRFVPTTNWSGTVTNGLSFRAWDQSEGATSGNTADTAPNGGTTAFSTTIANAAILVTASNTAPTLVGANNLAPILEDPATNPGTLVSTLIAGQISDVDPGALSGIAVTAVDDSNGTWQYTVNGGGTWTNFGTPSNSAARLLASNASTAVRFVPNPNWNGTIGNGISFRAWDQTSGTNGGSASIVSTNEAVADTFSSTSYSNNDGSQSWTGSWAETDGGSGGVASGSIRVHTGNKLLRIDGASSGHNIYRQADLTGAATATLSFSYDSSGFSSGESMAIQVSSNGGASYATLKTYDFSNRATGTDSFDLSAYASSTTRIRFYVGSSVGSRLDIDNVQIAYTTTGGGTSAFSTTTASAGITINAVNDAPVRSTGTPTAINVNEDSSNFTAVSVGLSSLAYGPGGGADEVGQTFSYRITAIPPAITLWLADGTTPVLSNATLTLPQLQGLKYKTVADASGSANLSWIVLDNGGTANSGVDTLTETLSITVTAVNDAPVVTPSGGSLPYTENQGATAIDSLLTVSDIDNANLSGATVSILVNYASGEDVLGFTNQNGISGAWNAGTGVLTLSGSSSVAFYQAALRSVTYLNTSDDPNALTRTISFVANDGAIDSAVAVKTVAVTAVNDAPTSGAVALVAIAEDSGPRLITQAELLANASDVDGPSLSAFNLLISSGAGSLIDNGDGTWTYTPALNDDSFVSFSYTVTDGSLTAAGSATLDITPVNDVPSTSPVTLAAIAEDSGPRLITQAELLSNAVDVDGPSLSAINLAISNGAGSLFDNGDGTWTYTPALNDDTGVSFSYIVTDGSLAAPGSATLDITPVNDAPTTSPVNLAAIAEDSGPRLITHAELLATATDVDGPSLTAINLAISSGAGSLLDNGDGTWTYTPALNDDSAVSFSYTVTDGSLTAPGSATLDITPVNDAPTTSPVTLAAIAEDSGPRLITQAEMLANAADVDGPSLTAINLVISSGAGSLIDNGDGTWTYSPALNDDSAVSFSYTITDGSLTAPGSATLDITPVNDAPATSPVTLIAIAEDSGARVITQAELLANASDVDGPSLTAVNLIISSGAGSLFDNGNGTWTYTPELNDDSSVNFSYTATDGSLSAAGSATLDITPINDVPTTAPVTLIAIAEDSGARLITQAELLANSVDVDGPSLTAVNLDISSGAGALVDNGDSTWTYTPALNDDTDVSFSYTVTDGSLTAAGSATLDITPVNDAPTTSLVTLSAIAEDSGPRLITQAELLANAADVDGPSLTAINLAISGGAGSLLDNGDGTWTYSPALNDDSAASFSYTVTDGSLTVAGSATLDITPVNDAPATSPVPLAAIAEDSGTRLIAQAELLANAADIDGPTLTAINLVISSGAGSLLDNGDGTWTYAPALNDDTGVSFSYTVTDGSLTTAGSATLDITPVNDTPTTSPVTLAAIAEDSGPRLITQAELLANASDVDGPSLIAINLAISSGAGSLLNNGDGTWTYTPVLNDDSGVTFSYSVTDGSLIAAGSATLDITPVNDAPTTSPVTLAAIAEDSGPRLITQAELLSNAVDVDGPSLTAINLVISSGAGSLVENGDRTWTYTPALNDDSAVSFSYTVTDNSLTAVGSAALDITPINDAPITSPVALAAIVEDSGPRLMTQAELLANASDVDGPSLTAINLVVSSGSGTLVDNGDGTWTYTPALNDDAGVSFNYTVTDGSLTAPGSATLDITPVNDAPTTSPVTLAAIAEDSGPRLITQAELLATAADVDGPSLTAINLVISSGAGSLIDNGDGTWTYTPTPNDETGVSFSFDVTDGSLMAVGNATLDFTPVNDVPTTSPVVLTAIAEDSGPRLITQAELLANAADFDGPGLTATSLAISSGTGFLVDNGDGTWAYTPALNDDTGVSFSYTVTDGSLTAAGTATLDITPVNDAPTNSPVTLVAIAEDISARLITQAELLANAADVDGPSLTATNLAIATGSGSLIDNGDGTWTYTPALNDDSFVSFSYTVTDGSLTVAGSATLDITPVHDAPTTSPVTLAAIAEDSGPRLITQAELLANASDVDGSSLTAVNLVISSGIGWLIDNGNGTWTYTPALDDDSSVQFSYVVTDGSLTAPGSATLDITPVDDTPVGSLGPIDINGGASVVVGSSLLQASDTDTALDAIGFVVLDVQHGRFESVAAPGIAITQFSLAEVRLGHIAFVSTSAVDAPSFTLAPFDGNSYGEPIVSSIDFRRSILSVSAATPDITPDGKGTVVVDLTTPNDGRVAAQTGTDLEVSRGKTVDTPLSTAGRDLQVLPAPQGIILAEAANADTERSLTHTEQSTEPARPRRTSNFDNPDFYTRVSADDYVARTDDFQLFDLVLLTSSSSRGGIEGFEAGPQANEEQNNSGLTLSDAAKASAVALTAGTVWWALRAGSLLTGLLVTLPTWRHADLLAVLPDEEAEDSWDLAEDKESARDERAVDLVFDAANEGERR